MTEFLNLHNFVRVGQNSCAEIKRFKLEWQFQRKNQEANNNAKSFFFHRRVRLLKRMSSVATGAPRLVRGELVFAEVLFVPFTTEFNKVGDAEAAAAARAPARRDVAVLAGGVLSSVSNIVAGLGGILYCVGVIPRRSSIMRS